MATLSKVSTGGVAAPELDLLLHWEQRHTPSGWLGIITGSVLLNLLLILGMAHAPAGSPIAPPEHRVILKKTRLYMPRDLMTQRAPNTRTPSKNIDLNSLLEVQGTRSRRAAPNPSTRHFELPPAVIPKSQQKTAKAPKPVPAPEVAMNQEPANPVPGSPNGLTVNVPPPPAPPPDQPFQNVGSEPLNSHPTMAVPKATVQSALKSLAQPPSGTHLEINDDNQSQPSPPPVPGVANQSATQHAAIELESDPQGADFKAYLARVLASCAETGGTSSPKVYEWVHCEAEPSSNSSSVVTEASRS